MLALRQLQKPARICRRHFSLVARPVVCQNVVLQPGTSSSIEGAQKNNLQRSFSSHASSSAKKAFPQYSVFGETAMMSLKLMTPSFKYLRGENLVLDQNRRGRLLLEFTPRSGDGTCLWKDQVRFALSPEEVGLLCSQLPQFGIELTRKPSSYQHSSEDEAQYGMHSDMPDKVLKVEPGAGATVTFSIDHVKDGIGGQSPGPGQGEAAPIDVTVQAGEFEVITSLMKTSIPHLVGWNTLVEVSVQWSVEDAIHGGGNPRYSGGGSVPF